METKAVHTIFFSPARSTRQVVKAIAEGISTNITHHDITQGIKSPIEFSGNEFVVIGVPVYSGRVPPLAVQYLSEIEVNKIPAIIVCVYGNREYEDTLLELKEICEKSGFMIISAGAFIARHSIFPKVAEGRPDANDLVAANDFGKKSLVYYIPDKVRSVIVKGNFPYRDTKPIPLRPKGDSKCNDCGTCVTLCPVNAISREKPRRTDKNKCISCARCIESCPKKARNFHGLIYKIATRQFMKNFGTLRKEIELFLPDNN